MKARLSKQSWIIAAIIVGIFWFVYNITLSPLYRGLICCDSVVYMSISKLPLNELVTYIAERTFGYPLFLGIWDKLSVYLGHQELSVTVVLIVQLIMHFIAGIFLIRSCEQGGCRVPGWCYFLVLAYPSLTSYAALPLTDSFSTSLVTLSVGCVIRFLVGNRRWWLVGAGMLYGYATLVRPSLLPVGFVSFVIFALAQIRLKKLKETLLTVMVLFISFGVPVSYNLFLGYRTFGVITFQGPDFYKINAHGSAVAGLEGARVYTTFNPSPALVFTNDPFSKKYLHDVCDKTIPSPGRMLLDCYMKTFPASVVHIGKKIIGLYDNFHLNGYAVDITTRGHILIYRFWGVLSFLGLLCAAFFLLGSGIERMSGSRFRFFVEKSYFNEISKPMVTVSIALVIFLLINANTHMEARYGFPAMPLSIVMLGVAYRAIRNHKIGTKWVTAMLTTGLLGAVLFLLQVIAWDNLKI